jgi:hypothetical protein
MQDNMMLPEEKQNQASLGPGADSRQPIPQLIEVYASRADLIPIIEQQDWTTLTRNERRLKDSALAKLKSIRE